MGNDTGPPQAKQGEFAGAAKVKTYIAAREIIYRSNERFMESDKVRRKGP